MRTSGKRRRIKPAINKLSDNRLSSNFSLYTGMMLLGLIFLFGGSSRPEVPGLILLRPFAIMVSFYFMILLSRSQLRAYRSIFICFGALFLICVCHIIPLPPNLWRALPGREMQKEIVDAAGGIDVWLPLSMAPSHAINALFSLFVPLAIIMVMIRLSYHQQRQMMVAIVVLLAVSALVGVVQIGGINIRLYAVSSVNSGLFANRNHQAVGMIVLLMFGIYLINSPNGIAAKHNAASMLISIAFLIMMAVLIMVTGSRLGLILLPISLSLSWWVQDTSIIQKSLEKNVWTKNFVRIGILIILVIIGITVTAYSRNEAFNRLISTNDELRFQFWSQLWGFMPNYLPWGSGIGSYATVYQIHEPDRLLNPGYSNHAHNDWLEVLLTVGYPGLIMMLATIGLFFKSFLVVMRSVSTHKRAKMGFSVMIVFAIASLVDYPLRTPILSSILAMVWVWVCHGHNAAKEV